MKLVAGFKWCVSMVWVFMALLFLALFSPFLLLATILGIWEGHPTINLTLMVMTLVWVITACSLGYFYWASHNLQLGECMSLFFSSNPC
ncbi:hypothetical protein HNP46_000412 [Pseudomonas nitritireducens]|uniref:Uncharacterized protein n=1 Tax=Pseudomonas nitroreducens TaxID=46680 RepID=A0A7W7KFP5_PSENT|nr:hypothetical protein [Pseudomonas nitritireducens]MBB4861601.1 hypothetical protein [Pseudomonas nitritireducens]